VFSFWGLEFPAVLLFFIPPLHLLKEEGWVLRQHLLRHPILSIRYSTFPTPCRLLKMAEPGKCPMSNFQVRGQHR
jgi:hypothetical protein